MNHYQNDQGDFTHGLRHAETDPHADAGFIAATQPLWDGLSPDLDAYEQRDYHEEAMEEVRVWQEKQDMLNAKQIVSSNTHLTLGECGDEITLALQQFDRGEIGLERLGLLVLNVRNAQALRLVNEDTSPEFEQAAAIALLGVAI